MRIRSERGFTLIELIVVIVIIGILAAVAVPKFLDLSDSAKVAACKQNQAAIETAASLYYAKTAIDGSAVFPAAVATLVTQDYLDVTPVCPSAGTYTFVDPGNSPQVQCSVAGHARFGAGG